MQLQKVILHLQDIAPLNLAEPWDNVGLLIGDTQAMVDQIMVCVDATPQVMSEAAAAGANLVVAYHPPLLRPVARLPWNHPLARALQHGIAVYSPHTAFDAVEGGTNTVLAEAAGLQKSRPLIAAAPESDARLLVVYVPHDAEKKVTEALFAAGAGALGKYRHCSFGNDGQASFVPNQDADPSAGAPDQPTTSLERRIEVRLRQPQTHAVIEALRRTHPNEEVAFNLFALCPTPGCVGQGRVGNLPHGHVCDLQTLARRLQVNMGLTYVTYAVAPGPQRPLQRIAVAAGAGDALWPAAQEAGADVFVTGELRHHTVLAAMAAGSSVIALGHDGSERAAIAQLVRALGERAPDVRVWQSRVDAPCWRVLT